jgi:hypothetical protein
MLRLVILVVASLLAMELVVWLAVSADAREIGLVAPSATTSAGGIAIAVLYTFGGLVVLARPVVAAMLFVSAAALGLLFGREDEAERLVVYGILALLLAAASAICARWHQPPRVATGRGRNGTNRPPLKNVN